jgi:ribosomal protein S18 acetylase RimI-like enzyme
MHIKIIDNTNAKEYLKTDDNFKDILEDVYIIEWLDEKNVKLYLLFNEEDIVSFSLLSKMGRDPLKKHTNPYHLSYIYTFEKHRRKGYANYLLQEVKKELETTVFCTNDNNKDLFEKAGYSFESFDTLYNSFPIYRFP